MERVASFKACVASLALLGSACAASAAPAPAPCADIKAATTVLGTSRTLSLPREAAAYGRVQHGPLPLQPGEVVLTFDDGPQPGSTPQVLQALAAQCVQATFFMNGESLRAAPALGRQVRDAGHTVAMHGYRHPHFASMPEAEQLADLSAMQAVFEHTLGRPAAAWRFPFLEETPALRAELKAQKITVMSVDLGLDDWLPDQSPAMLTERLLARLKDTGGGIILLHDAQVQTATALPMMLKALQTHGYRVVHLRWD
ncbi:polysaccharide deacetylase family protein [Ideonella sp.]|uniref:polysaccharide deacetylase family protein n=1 Tax=Ideonella sp. TaxID=1929293 RepID=UPI003BB5FCC0